MLRDHPDRVDNHILSTFEEFREFKARTRTITEQATETVEGAPTGGLSVAKGGAPRDYPSGH